jgi:hypothetical protein
LLGIEFDLPGCLLIKPLYAADGREDCARGKKIAVADVAEYSVFGPFWVFEAFVRCAGRRWFATEQMPQCPRPQADALFPKLELRARDRSRIGHKLGCQLKEGLTDLGRIAHPDIGHVWSVYEEPLYRSLAFCRQRLKSFRQNCWIQRRGHFAVSHGIYSLSRSNVPARRSICRLLATSCQYWHRHVTRLSTDGGHSSSEVFPTGIRLISTVPQRR